VSNVGAQNFIKQILLDLKAQMDPNTILLRDFNMPLLLIHRSLRPKNKQTNKQTKKPSELNDTIDHRPNGLTDIYKVFHSAAAQCTFFLLQPMKLSPK
jgi:hypothetical protein